MDSPRPDTLTEHHIRSTPLSLDAMLADTEREDCGALAHTKARTPTFW